MNGHVICHHITHLPFLTLNSLKIHNSINVTTNNFSHIRKSDICFGRIFQLF
jgi:hypothetical protein